MSLQKYNEAIRIKFLKERAERKLSQANIENLTGIHRGSISKIELGKQYFSLAQLGVIYRKVGINLFDTAKEAASNLR